MRSIFSVTTAAESLSLLSVADLRAAAGVSGESEDEALATLGLRLSASIARACGVASDGINPPTLLSEVCTEVFRLDDCQRFLRLSRRPVSAVTSVVEDGEAVASSGYEIDPASGSLVRLTDDTPTEWSGSKVTVVYVAGYVEAPDDLALAASKLATALYAETGRDPSLKKQEIPGVVTNEFWVAPSADPLMTAEMSDLLAPYRQFWF